MNKPPPKPDALEKLTPDELREIQERPKEVPLTPRQAVQIERMFKKREHYTLT